MSRHFLDAAVTALRMVGYYQAVELERLAEYARATEDDEFADLEVSTLLHTSDRAAQARLRLARDLTERLLSTLNAVRDGQIEEYKAKLIADAVVNLSSEQATTVETRVLPKAGQQTVGQLRAALTKAVLIADPDGAEERRRERLAQRRVSAQHTEEGMAVLSLHHSADIIDAIRALISKEARFLKWQPGETRTLEQLEADVAADLLLGSDRELRHIEVHLTIPATTAAGLDDQPGDLEGTGPVTAHQARDLFVEATRWRWIRTDPHTGEVVDLGLDATRTVHSGVGR